MKEKNPDDILGWQCLSFMQSIPWGTRITIQENNDELGKYIKSP